MKCRWLLVLNLTRVLNFIYTRYLPTVLFVFKKLKYKKQKKQREPTSPQVLTMFEIFHHFICWRETGLCFGDTFSHLFNSIPLRHHILSRQFSSVQQQITLKVG